jgi:hypothetical protein
MQRRDGTLAQQVLAERACADDEGIPDLEDAKRARADDKCN